MCVLHDCFLSDIPKGVGRKILFFLRRGQIAGSLKITTLPNPSLLLDEVYRSITLGNQTGFHAEGSFKWAQPLKLSITDIKGTNV